MQYTIEIMETTGPKEHNLELNDAVSRLNLELENGRVIFVDGAPIQTDIITPEIVQGCKNTITVMNKLIGG